MTIDNADIIMTYTNNFETKHNCRQRDCLVNTASSNLITRLTSTIHSGMLHRNPNKMMMCKIQKMGKTKRKRKKVRKRCSKNSHKKCNETELKSSHYRNHRTEVISSHELLDSSPHVVKHTILQTQPELQIQRLIVLCTIERIGQFT